MAKTSPAGRDTAIEEVTPSADPTAQQRPKRWLFRVLSSDRWLSVATVGFLLLVWWIVAELEVVPPLFIPKPAAVWEAFISTSFNPYRGHILWAHLAISLQRLGSAFVLAVLTGVPLGILVALSKKLQASIEPLINFYRPLPPLAYYTLLIIWLGIGEASKIVLLYLAAFPPIFIGR